MEVGWADPPRSRPLPLMQTLPKVDTPGRRPPGHNDWQTLLKILPCLKLRLRAVKIEIWVILGNPNTILATFTFVEKKWVGLRPVHMENVDVKSEQAFNSTVSQQINFQIIGGFTK